MRRRVNIANFSTALELFMNNTIDKFLRCVNNTLSFYHDYRISNINHATIPIENSYKILKMCAKHRCVTGFAAEVV